MKDIEKPYATAFKDKGLSDKDNKIAENADKAYAELNIAITDYFIQKNPLPLHYAGEYSETRIEALRAAEKIRESRGIKLGITDDQMLRISLLLSIEGRISPVGVENLEIGSEGFPTAHGGSGDRDDSHDDSHDDSASSGPE